MKSFYQTNITKERKMLDGTFHIEVDHGKIVAVKVHYAGPVVVELNNVRVSVISPCIYKGNYYYVNDSLMVPINLFCDLELDETGTPIPNNYLKPLFYFVDESREKRKVYCKVFADYPGVSDDTHAVRIFTSCRKFGSQHKRRDVLYIKKDELMFATYRPVQMNDLRRKRIDELDQ